MAKVIDRNKTLENQVWDDIAPRVRWFTAKQLARKLMISISYVRHLCEWYYKREVLDKKVVGKTNYYRIKP